MSTLNKDQKALVEKAQTLGAAAAKRGDKDSPTDDWLMLDMWCHNTPMIGPGINQQMKYAWKQGFEEEMQKRTECVHCGKRVLKEDAVLSEDYCDACYIRYGATAAEIDVCVRALRSAKTEKAGEV